MLNISSNRTLVTTAQSTEDGNLYLTNRTLANGIQALHILVQRQSDGWQPVTKLKQSIDRYQFQNEYGFVPAKIDENGAPGFSNRNFNSAAVLSSGLQYKKEHKQFIAGEELTQTESGHFVIRSKQVQIPEGRKLSQSERTEVLEIHYDNTEWSVLPV